MNSGHHIFHWPDRGRVRNGLHVAVASSINPAGPLSGRSAAALEFEAVVDEVAPVSGPVGRPDLGLSDC